MKRRDVLALLGAAAACWPLATRAQQTTRTPLVAVISPFLDKESTFVADLREGLRERGLVEGRDIRLVYRSAEGQIELLPGLFAEMIRLNVNVIVTATAPAVRVARQATVTIPIIMSRVGDAVDQGFVSSLARPGGNVTGTSWLSPELIAKRMEILKEAFPTLTRVGVLREATASANSVAAAQIAARRLGMRVYVFEVRDADEFATAFRAMVEAQVEAIEVLEGLMVFNNIAAIVALATATGLPTIYPEPGFVEAGGLISYAPDVVEMQRSAAGFVEKILRGAKPGDIPVEQPTRFELAINTHAARMLGIALPLSLLVRADRVVD